MGFIAMPDDAGDHDRACRDEKGHKQEYEQGYVILGHRVTLFGVKEEFTLLRVPGSTLASLFPSFSDAGHKDRSQFSVVRSPFFFFVRSSES